MSMCRTYQGKLKIKHASKEAAQEHAQHHQDATVHAVQTYRCARCGYWHIGRRATPKTVKREIRYKALTEERLVGLLMGALRRSVMPPKQEAKK